MSEINRDPPKLIVTSQATTPQTEEAPVKPTETKTNNNSVPFYNAHIFYYPWYGNPATDGEYLHWNHEVLPGGNLKTSPKRYKPPEDIGADFYPQLGPYSSNDDAVIDTHFQQLREMRVGVACISWYPANSGDDQLRNKPGFSDMLTLKILNIADKYDIKITFHIEPYKGRTALTVKEDIRYIITKYGKHNAFFIVIQLEITCLICIFMIVIILPILNGLKYLNVVELIPFEIRTMMQ